MVNFARIKQLRTRQGLSFSAAAEAAGWGRKPQRWYGIERGTRPDLRVSTLMDVAKALGVKAGSLLIEVRQRRDSKRAK